MMPTSIPASALSHLECPQCGARFDAARVQTFCTTCPSPLVARYDLPVLARSLDRDAIQKRHGRLWRWAELLPVQDAAFRLTLGEGGTPLLSLEGLARSLNLRAVYIKDEALNPTGSFKARGLAVAVARAVELGLHAFSIPTAGNAGGALAAYAALHGVGSHVFMPADAPYANQWEVQAAGSALHLVDGLINDAGREAAAFAKNGDWFDVSTFKEPYRLEGKKTMGFELVEQLDWQVPDVIIYPTGGGTGLVGIWKAIDELQALGWVDGTRPRMVAVQSAGCAPVVKAFMEGWLNTEPWPDAFTYAAGLRVPSPFAGRMILDVLRTSHGTAITVTDDEMRQSQITLASQEGVFTAPEGAATLAALSYLRQMEWIKSADRVVLLNTGSAFKYL